MSRLFPLAAVSVVFALAACAEDPPALRDSNAADSKAADTAGAASTAAPGAAQASFAGRSFGEKITAADEVSLADIVADPSKFADKTVRTTGTVRAVCQKAGCWMEIGDDEKRAHIKMAGHAFSVPRASNGHNAIVQGVVKGGEPQNECGTKDACGGTENGAIAKIEIVATGVEFVD